MFYSAQIGGFYTKEIHGDAIPSDAVEITPEEHAVLMDGQAKGKRIVPNKNGYPVLVDPPLPTSDELASAARAKRDRLLSESDWIVAKSIEAAEQVPSAWIEYRQSLRDTPEQNGFPSHIEWPARPE